VITNASQEGKGGQAIRWCRKGKLPEKIAQQGLVAAFTIPKNPKPKINKASTPLQKFSGKIQP
jgi:hypothetical protein